MTTYQFTDHENNRVKLKLYIYIYIYKSNGNSFYQHGS